MTAVYFDRSAPPKATPASSQYSPRTVRVAHWPAKGRDTAPSGWMAFDTAYMVSSQKKISGPSGKASQPVTTNIGKIVNNNAAQSPISRPNQIRPTRKSSAHEPSDKAIVPKRTPSSVSPNKTVPDPINQATIGG